MYTDLRKRILAERKCLDDDVRKNYNAAIFKNVVGLKAFNRALNVFTYVNTLFEAETTGIIEYSLRAGKRVFVPKTDKEWNMTFIEITSLENLKEGFMGIREPESGEEKQPQKGDLFIVPGSVFDIKGHRMGYGRGCYDRYFAKYPDVIKTALCYDFQLLESIPKKEHDADMDILITDKRIVAVKGDENE